jgi:putative ABC transport system permease protein
MLRQLVAVTALNFKGLRDRFWSALVIVVGMACVAGVLLSMLSFSVGLRRTILSVAEPDRAIVVREGGEDEYGQAISREAAVTIMNAPGIRKDGQGAPIASTENVNNIPTVRQDGGLPIRMVLRGVGEKGFDLRPEFRLVGGRMFQSGTRELLVGIGAQAQFANLNIGDKVIMPDGEWTIVGAFETGGDQIEGQLLGEIDTVLASRRQNGFGSVHVRLESPDSFETFRTALTENPTLDVTVERQSTFYERSAGGFSDFFTSIAYLLGGILAVGAMFGTLNIMHSSVAARAKEIATLRALGFGAFPVATSVLLEALLLATTGALLGAAIAWLLFNGNRNSVGGIATVFELAVTPGLIAIGLIWALAIALLGGIVPAIRAARLPVVTALRAG